ncbi:hypothetical protein V1291_000816 [Nitrobacteraceae bacterium AZCC 1564]
MLGRVVIAGIVAYVGCYPSKAAEFGYHPSNTLFLGAGLDAADPTSARPTCLTFKTARLGGGVDSVRFEAKMIKSRKELYESLSVSASLSARYSFFGGAAGLNLDNQYSFTSDELVWIVYGFTDYGRFGIADAPTLVGGDDISPANLIAKKMYTEFSDKCGSEVVIQERRGAWAAVIYSARGMSESSKKSLEASFSASVGSGLFSADVQTKYKSFLQNAAQLSQIKVSAYGVGGGGISDISSLVTDYTDVNKVAEALAKYMKDFNEKTAVPLTYYTQSMKIVGWKPTKSLPDIASIDAFLTSYYDFLQTLNSLNGRITRILNNVNNGLSSYLTEKQISELNGASSILFSSRKKLVQLAIACNADLDSCRSEADLRKDILKLTIPDMQFVGDVEVAKAEPISSCIDERVVVGGGILVGQTREAYRTAYLLRAVGDWDFVENFALMFNGVNLNAREVTAGELSKSPELQGPISSKDKPEVSSKSVQSVDPELRPKASSRWNYRLYIVEVPNLGGLRDDLVIRWTDKFMTTNLRSFSVAKPPHKPCSFAG